MKKGMFKIAFWIGCLALIGFSFQNCSLYTSEGRKAFEEGTLDASSFGDDSFASSSNRGATTFDQDPLARGFFVYETLTVGGVSCASCHREDGLGSGPSCPNSTTCPPITGLSVHQLTDAVRNGPGAMPSYTDSQFLDSDFEHLKQYLDSL